MLDGDMEYWVRTLGGDIGYRAGDMGTRGHLTPSEQQEGRQAAVTREGGEDQQLVQEEPLGQQPPVVGPDAVLSQCLCQPAPGHRLRGQRGQRGGTGVVVAMVAPVVV